MILILFFLLLKINYIKVQNYSDTSETADMWQRENNLSQWDKVS